MSPLITFGHVTKAYRPGDIALRDVSFSVHEGEFLCLIGPSGEGKSTILKLVCGLEEATAGTVVRPEHVAMVFQSVALFPWLSVFDNVALGLRARHMPEAEVKKISMQYIELMKLTEFISHRPTELSGGQKQRVGIARALALDPEVLLLDEPFSALDPKTTAELHDDIIAIWEKTGKTMVMVSHLIEEAVSLAGRILLVKHGKIAHSFDISLPYPRREQETAFMQEVGKIRTEFFK